MEIKLSINKEVYEKHKDRIEEVILSSELKNRPNNWTATESDYYRDRVYLFNNIEQKEYSIAFDDGESGYNYYVYQRQPITDDAYELIMAERPELAEYDRDALASVEQISEGFKRRFMPRRENMFKRFLSENNIDIDNNKMFLSVGVTSSNLAFNAIVQVMPWSEEVIIIKRISYKQFGEVFGGLCELNSSEVINELNQKAKCVRMVVDGDINPVLDDIVSLYESKGFTVKLGEAKISS